MSIGEEVSGLQNRPSEDVAEILFDLVSENATDLELDRILQAIQSLRDRRVLRGQPVAKDWAEAMMEAVNYRKQR